MHDLVLVQVGKTFDASIHDFDGLSFWNLSFLLDQTFNITTSTVLHNDVQTRSGLIDFVDLKDVVMVEFS